MHVLSGVLSGFVRLIGEGVASAEPARRKPKQHRFILDRELSRPISRIYFLRSARRPRTKQATPQIASIMA